ncbi:MAG: GNAT family N-acetyltransferase [Spirochaetales bacterium]|nr:GNAT family N-acetyltransferase [Spirochaetales bacterium]
MEITRIAGKDVPHSILYLADEDDDQIGKYRDSALFWAAREDGKIVGSIGLAELSPVQAEIVSVAVLEEYQNRHFGSQLVETALAYCKEEGFEVVLIKTGNCGLSQIGLYQKCGFRIDSVNRDYFSGKYEASIYENGIRCCDQVVLSYRIYGDEERKSLIDHYWSRFTASYPRYKGSPYEVWNFCYGEYLPDLLIGLVKTGRKKGTSSALELYGPGEKVPAEGDLSIITYGNGLPGCIIRTVETRVKKFCDIGAEEARLEGEGDLSLNFWREVHKNFFSLEYKEEGKIFSEDIPVLFERFEVIYDEDRKGF